MTWGRLGHPSELLKVGQELEVVVLDINKEKERVSLGLKQTQKNPWDQIEERFPAGQQVKGKVTNLVPYGAFVEIEEGVEGLIHVSELSWTKRITRPSRRAHRRARKSKPSCSASTRRSRRSRLASASSSRIRGTRSRRNLPIGSQRQRQVRNLTAYGAFVELEEGIDGMIHVSDMSWTRKINHPMRSPQEGRRSRSRRHRHRQANQRISLGIKQLDDDPWKDIDAKYKIGDLVNGKVTKLASFGAFVAVAGRHRRPRPHLADQRRPRREGQGRPQGRPGSRSARHQGRQGRAPHRSLDQGRQLHRGRTQARSRGLRQPRVRAKTWSASRRLSKPPRKIIAPAKARKSSRRREKRRFHLASLAPSGCEWCGACCLDSAFR